VNIPGRLFFKNNEVVRLSLRQDNPAIEYFVEISVRDFENDIVALKQ
jgi:hypothetical protein